MAMSASVCTSNEERHGFYWWRGCWETLVNAAEIHRPLVNVISKSPLLPSFFQARAPNQPSSQDTRRIFFLEHEAKFIGSSIRECAGGWINSRLKEKVNKKGSDVDKVLTAILQRGMTHQYLREQWELQKQVQQSQKRCMYMPFLYLQQQWTKE